MVHSTLFALFLVEMYDRMATNYQGTRLLPWPIRSYCREFNFNQYYKHYLITARGKSFAKLTIKTRDFEKIIKFSLFQIRLEAKIYLNYFNYMEDEYNCGQSCLYINHGSKVSFREPIQYPFH